MKAKNIVFALVVSCAISGLAWADGESLMGGNNDLGKTGGGTLGKTGGGTLAADPSSPAFTVSLDSDSLAGAGTVNASISSGPDANAAPEANGAYDIPLTSSDEACAVPDFVTVTWSSATGGTASFQVKCTAVATDRLVTITAGNAAVGFVLKH
jgi:hypothetical protein